jgi:Fervidolysin N-terminal prodomain
MKRFTFAILLAGLFIFAAATMPQDKMMMQQKHAQMMEMMKDSTMVNAMMDHIVSDSHLRTTMMRKLAEFAKTDASVMTEMHKMMQGESAAQTSAEKEVLIKFKPSVKSAQIKAMESEFGLQQIKEIPALNVRVYRITSTKTVKEVIENCGKHAFVEYAEPNYKYKTQK